MKSNRHKKYSPESEKLAEKILDYLGQNPRAMDTAEGISQWWVNSRIENVDKALSLLIQGKLIQAVSMEAGIFYCVVDNFLEMNINKKVTRPKEKQKDEWK